MLGCGRASISAIRKRMDRGWAGRSPGSWSGTSSSRSTERVVNNTPPARAGRDVLSGAMRTSASWAGGAVQSPRTRGPAPGGPAESDQQDCD